MAERQGFEPWVGSPPQRFSRPPRSTAPASLRWERFIGGAAGRRKGSGGDAGEDRSGGGERGRGSEDRAGDDEMGGPGREGLLGGRRALLVPEVGTARGVSPG